MEFGSMPVWLRSGRCESAGCVEVAVARHEIQMRDSKDAHGPVLTFSQASWSDFLAGIRGGEFDLD